MRVNRIVACIFILFSTAVPALAGPACDHVNLEWLSGQVPLSEGAKIVFKQERSGLCEVIVAIDGSLAPVYAGKDFIVAGRMYRQKYAVTRETMAGLRDIAEKERQDAQERDALALEKRKAFFKARHAELEALVSMTFGPGSAKETVYVITDPNCSHCKKLLPLMEEVAFEAGVRLKMIIYPVLGDKSRDMAAHALCNKFTYAQYKEMTGTETLAVCEASTDLLSRIKTFFESAGISFVPLVVAGDGSWVVEGSDINEVRGRLGLDCEEGAGGKEGCGSGQNQ
ncbi:MAG: thioredoxin fold domain-containing protein [Desulfobacter sp.]|nr:MAG: thioredoxin fold domain-containing protein [Desulfobacter sp.]